MPAPQLGLDLGLISRSLLVGVIYLSPRLTGTVLASFLLHLRLQFYELPYFHHRTKGFTNMPPATRTATRNDSSSRASFVTINT